MAKLKDNKLLQSLYLTYKNYKKYIYASLINYEFEKAKDSSLTLEEIKEYNAHRETHPQRILCNAPFTSLYFGVNGNVTVCGYNKSVILGNVSTDKMKDIWNSDKQKELQQYILNYDLKHGCQLCLQKIKTKDYHRASIYYDTPVYDNSNLLRKVTFELSNLCNLECVMCNGELSSQIRKNREGRAPLKGFYTEEFVDDIAPYLKDLVFAQFLGGEPLLIKIYYPIWNKIIEINKKCRISLQTNATILPAKFEELLQSGQFTVGVSIDSFKKEKFEKIRFRADFDEVMRNVERYLDYRKKGLIDMLVNFVPMNINYDEIPDVLSFANKHNISLSMCELEFPYEYSFKSMKSSELVNAIEYLEKYKLKANYTHTLIQKQNIKVYNDHILQLKNLLQIIKEVEKEYPYENDFNELKLKQDFDTRFNEMPFSKHEKIRGLFFDYISNYEGRDSYKEVLFYLNQYFCRRVSFFKEYQNLSDLDTSYEHILLNEFRSVLKNINDEIELK